MTDNHNLPNIKANNASKNKVIKEMKDFKLKLQLYVDEIRIKIIIHEKDKAFKYICPIDCKLRFIFRI